ncbi:MAG: hypothetical protein WC790_01740, partial [Candidatus Paceibacterota bacterium]
MTDHICKNCRYWYKPTVHPLRDYNCVDGFGLCHIISKNRRIYKPPHKNELLAAIPDMATGSDNLGVTSLLSVHEGHSPGLDCDNSAYFGG